MLTFAYGDSCKTGDRKYVIAQFRADASLSWVVDLRSCLSVRELKYKYFEPQLQRIKSNRELWRNVWAGVRQCEITITDPQEYKDNVILTLLDQHAEPNIDFDERTVNNVAARWMIADSPLTLADSVTVDWAFENSDSEYTHNFTSDEICKRAGGKLTDAIVVTARSHAMVGPLEKRELLGIGALTGSGFYGAARVKLEKLSRTWDVEHPKSLPILNEFSERIAYMAAGRQMRVRSPGDAPVVRESESLNSDHLQAADMEAGWAANLLTLSGGDYRSLAQSFSSVCVNGVAIPG